MSPLTPATMSRTLHRLSSQLHLGPTRSFSSTALVAPLSMVPPRSPTSTELAGFIPRPPPAAEKPKRKSKTGKILGLYFVVHAVPLTAALYYLQKQKEDRLRYSIACLPTDPEAIAQEATRIATSGAEAFVILHAIKNLSMQRVEALAPEEAPLRRNDAIAEAVPDMEKSELLSQFLYTEDKASSSSSSSGSDGSRYPLRSIHFAVPKNSELGKVLVDQGLRRHSMFYHSNIRNAYCTLTGTAVILEDPELRRRYWTDRWRSCVGSPMAVADQQEGAEVPSLCESPDYLLVRFKPDEVELRASTTGEAFAGRRIVLDGGKWQVQM